MTNTVTGAPCDCDFPSSVNGWGCGVHGSCLAGIDLNGEPCNPLCAPDGLDKDGMACDPNGRRLLQDAVDFMIN